MATSHAPQAFRKHILDTDTSGLEKNGYIWVHGATVRNYHGYSINDIHNIGYDIKSGAIVLLCLDISFHWQNIK